MRENRIHVPCNFGRRCIQAPIVANQKVAQLFPATYQNRLPKCIYLSALLPTFFDACPLLDMAEYAASKGTKAA